MALYIQISSFYKDTSHIGLRTHSNPICSVQFSLSVMSESLWPHGLQHAGFPVLHHHPEFAQTHVHWVIYDIQPSHPLSSPSPPASNLSQHQSLFQWVISSHQMTKVMNFQFQHHPFQSNELSVSASPLPMNILDWFPLEWAGWISLFSKGLSRVFPNTTVQKHQFFSAQLSL